MEKVQLIFLFASWIFFQLTQKLESRVGGRKENRYKKQRGAGAAYHTRRDAIKTGHMGDHMVIFIISAAQNGTRGCVKNRYALRLKLKNRLAGVHPQKLHQRQNSIKEKKNHFLLTRIIHHPVQSRPHCTRRDPRTTPTPPPPPPKKPKTQKSALWSCSTELLHLHRSVSELISHAGNRLLRLLNHFFPAIPTSAVYK